MPLWQLSMQHRYRCSRHVEVWQWCVLQLFRAPRGRIQPPSQMSQELQAHHRRPSPWPWKARCLGTMYSPDGLFFSFLSPCTLILGSLLLCSCSLPVFENCWPINGSIQVYVVPLVPVPLCYSRSRFGAVPIPSILLPFWKEAGARCVNKLS